MEESVPGPSRPSEREADLHRAVRLSQLSIAYSAVSGLAAALIGVIVGGLSLAGYGFDAIADAAASAILVHRFHTERQEPHRADGLERRAGRLVAVALVAISLYLAISAVRDLIDHHSPDSSAFGVTIACMSMIVLPPLALAKRRTAASLRSAALRADSLLTAVAAMLALGALMGLLLKPALGWWWADSVIALIVAGVLVRESLALRTID